MRQIAVLAAILFMLTRVAHAASPGDVVINEVAWSGSVAAAADEWIELYNNTDQPIDLSGVVDAACRPAAGAVVLFLGTVRETTDGRRTTSLEYECYREMAEKKLAELETDARRKWPLVECSIVHRLGHLAVGETSVAIAVSAPHRREAFRAGEWLIDRVKQVVPIWKKENYADGTSDWVHPATEPQPAAKDSNC